MIKDEINELIFLAKKNQKETYFILGLAAIGLASVLFSSQQGAYAGLLGLAFCQNISFTFVSRSRQRDSHTYHLIAAVCSNGVWFLTYGHMVKYHMPLGMLLPFLCGTTLGSLLAAYGSRKIEQKLDLTADATKIRKRSTKDKYIQYSLLFLLGIIGIAALAMSKEYKHLVILMVLAYTNNITSALVSRSKNRGHRNLLILTSFASWTTFVFTFSYLIRYSMDISLFVPYTVATVFGSITGARISMSIERVLGIRPLKKGEKKKINMGFSSISSFVHAWWLLLLIFFLGSSIIAIRYFFAPTVLVFPYQIFTFKINIMDKTIFVLLFGAIIFFMEAMSYTISSRASSRDNLIYHYCMRAFNGVVWFWTYDYIYENKMDPDIFIPMMLGGIMGNIFGQQTGEIVEQKIGAVMDAEKK